MSRSESPVRHRSNFQDSPLSYVEIGASEAVDLMRFPPNSSTPFTEELHVGSGEARFLAATDAMMTWRAFSAAGYELVHQHKGAAPQYSGLDEADTEPRRRLTTEELYGPDGSPYVSAGTHATFAINHGREREMYVLRVVYSAKETGLVLGTADSNGVDGEVRLAVQLRDDETVWVTARGFVHPPKSVVPLRSGAQVRSAITGVKRVLDAFRPGAIPESHPRPGAE